ncbi:TPA_asm: EO3 [Leatherback sea turtle adomavirus]|nr:TPA_asm: EO3 [Leatherback sea turtle adomavirus]
MREQCVKCYLSLSLYLRCPGGILSCCGHMSENQHYYKNVFPANLFWRLFGHPAREFAFCYQDRFQRHRFFRSEAAFVRFVSTNAFDTFHLGAINLKDGPAKELVIDIDLSDMPNRPCCKKNKTLCPLCLPYLDMAIDLIPGILKEAFGFHHVRVFFSGRRGIHIIVFDDLACCAQNRLRESIVLWLQRVLGDNGGPYHERVFDTYRQYFLLQLHSLLLADEHGHYLPSKGRRMFHGMKIAPGIIASVLANVQRLHEAFQGPVPSEAAAQCLLASLKEQEKLTGRSFRSEFLNNSMRIVLDIPVTSSTKHLYKAPFTVHPHTQKLALPVTMMLNVGVHISEALENPQLVENEARSCLLDFGIRWTKSECCLHGCKDIVYDCSQRFNSSFVTEAEERTRLLEHPALQGFSPPAARCTPSAANMFTLNGSQSSLLFMFSTNPPPNCDDLLCTEEEEEGRRVLHVSADLSVSDVKCTCRETVSLC